MPRVHVYNGVRTNDVPAASVSPSARRPSASNKTSCTDARLNSPTLALVRRGPQGSSVLSGAVARLSPISIGVEDDGRYCIRPESPPAECWRPLEKRACGGHTGSASSMSCPLWYVKDGPPLSAPTAAENCSVGMPRRCRKGAIRSKCSSCASPCACIATRVCCFLHQHRRAHATAAMRSTRVAASAPMDSPMRNGCMLPAALSSAASAVPAAPLPRLLLPLGAVPLA